MECPICKTEMRKLVVKKEGPNKGRPFWGCGVKDCDGFAWADDEEKKEEPKTETTPEATKPDWDAKDRRMVRMHAQKVAGTLVAKWMETEKALEEWASGFSTEGGQVVDLVKKIAHKLEDDVYRE